MTANDQDAARAREIVAALAEEHGHETFVTEAYGYGSDAIERIAAALRAAREGEREACLEAIELFDLKEADFSPHITLAKLAFAIRARGER